MERNDRVLYLFLMPKTEISCSELVLKTLKTILGKKMTSYRNMFGVALVLVVSLSAWAGFRTSSNVDGFNTESELAAKNDLDARVFISEGALPNQRKYSVIGPIEVTVKKLTIFHENPTKDHANRALAKAARAVGADAVINVTYKSGIGFTTWGYIDAKGTGVKLSNTTD